MITMFVVVVVAVVVGVGPVYEGEYAQREVEAALKAALEACQAENERLRISVQSANDRVEQVQTAYDSLIGQLQEDVSAAFYSCTFSRLFALTDVDRMSTIRRALC
jgi:Tfp pilus assembly protein PilE